MGEIKMGVFRRALLERWMSEEIHEDAASVIDEIAEALRDKDGVHVAWRGLPELVEVVVGERIFERDFDGSGGPICVWRNVDGHDVYGFTPRALFRVGAAGQDGQGAVDLLGEHDASEFVREGHGTERELMRGALAEIVRKAVGVAAQEDEFARTVIAEFSEPFCEGVRIKIFSGGVEKDYSGGAVLVESSQGGFVVTDFGDFDRTGAADALGIVLEDATHFRTASLAKHQEPNLHDRAISP
jgi:hypothetical protein